MQVDGEGQVLLVANRHHRQLHWKIDAIGPHRPHLPARPVGEMLRQCQQAIELAVKLSGATRLQHQFGESSTDHLVTVDGVVVDAEVWQSRIAGELLILSNALGSPVRLALRDARVETVQLMKVDKRSDGGLTLLPDAADRALGKFSVSTGGSGVTPDSSLKCNENSCWCVAVINSGTCSGETWRAWICARTKSFAISIRDCSINPVLPNLTMRGKTS